MNKNHLNIPKRGEIWLVKFPPTKESRKPIRPCLVISNDLQNEYGKWVVIVSLTHPRYKKHWTFWGFYWENQGDRNR